MASGSLRQLGKGLGKTKKEIDYTLQRYSQEFPMIEESLDTLGELTPFIMEFVTEIPKNNVSLSLYFSPVYGITQDYGYGGGTGPFDDFERTETLGWNGATPSHPYAWSFGIPFDNLGTALADVTAGLGRMLIGDTTGSTSSRSVIAGWLNFPDGSPWSKSLWTMEAVFDILWGDLTGFNTMGFHVARYDATASVDIVIHNEPGLESVMWGTDSTPIPLPFTFTGDVYEVHIKWEVVWGSVDRFKIWSTWLGQSEPAEWSYTSGPPTIAPDEPEVILSVSFLTVDAHSEYRQIRVESIDFLTSITTYTLIASDVTDTSLETVWPTNVQVWIDNVDITRWVFGSNFLTPTEDFNIWRNVDISSFVKGPGIHKLKITCQDAGKVQSRIAIR
jgi:hypothetical protein